jgi:hypothetical protein
LKSSSPQTERLCSRKTVLFAHANEECQLQTTKSNTKARSDSQKPAPSKRSDASHNQTIMRGAAPSLAQVEETTLHSHSIRIERRTHRQAPDNRVTIYNPLQTDANEYDLDAVDLEPLNIKRSTKVVTDGESKYADKLNAKALLRLVSNVSRAFSTNQTKR